MPASAPVDGGGGQQRLAVGQAMGKQGWVGGQDVVPALLEEDLKGQWAAGHSWCAQAMSQEPAALLFGSAPTDL